MPRRLPLSASPTTALACSTDGERLFVMLAIVVGMIWGATIISDVMSLLTEMDRTSSEAKERKRQLQTFFIKAKLPRALKQRCFKCVAAKSMWR